MIIEDTPEMLAVENLLLWSGRPNRSTVDALDRYGLVEIVDGRYLLTESAALIKAALHRAHGDERWELCQSYARRFAEEQGQEGLF